MFTNDPISLLSLHHSDHAELVARISRASARPVFGLRLRASSAYYAAVRRAYVHARAARLAAGRATL